MSFVWMCKCGEVAPDKAYLCLDTGVRKLTRCPGKDCKYFLSDYKRVQGKDDYGHV